MPTAQYHSLEAYAEALGALNAMSGAMLFEFARYGQANRDTIISNLVARSNTMSKGIFHLYELGDYQDCWILHRCLMDRLFHLEHLADTGEFDAFEEWSFWEQYTALRRVQEDPEFAAGAVDPVFDLTPAQADRAKALRKGHRLWRRPRAEEVATRLKVHFLYRYGYDYASRYVHPMADDGVRDFYTITGLQPAPAFPDERVVLANTLLIVTMLLQTAMNASTFPWRRPLHDFMEAVRAFLGDGTETYKVIFVRLGRALESGSHLAGPRAAG